MLSAHRERRRFTPEEYLQLETSSETRSEYHEGEIFLITGGSLNHNRIVLNLASSLGAALKGGPCQVFQSDARLLVEQHMLFTYPDILVVCGSLALMRGRTDTLTDARLILEVLSPSTEAYDRGEKFRMYRSLPSFEEYVLVAQDRTLVERSHRQSDGTWSWKGFVSQEDTLELQSVPVRLPLAQIYRDLPLAQAFDAGN